MMYDASNQRRLADLVIEGPPVPFESFKRERFPSGFDVETKRSPVGDNIYACVRRNGEPFTHFLYFHHKSLEFHIDERSMATGDTELDRRNLLSLLHFADVIESLLGIRWESLRYDNGDGEVRQYLALPHERGKQIEEYLHSLRQRTADD